MHHKRRIIFILSGFILLLAILFGYLFSNGYIWFNNPDPNQFPVRGIDVSSHQKDIDWNLVKQQDIDFAYIKATEGKDFVDKQFETNWENARKAGLKVGGYHFFTFRSSGIDQAKNFISIVPKEEGSLPPAIDLEFGGNSSIISDKKTLQKELDIFIREIKEYYKQEPILYVLYNSYDKYIHGGYIDNEIWIRDIFKYPELIDDRSWIFWQYCNRGRLKGIEGFVDLSVFIGTEEDMKSFSISR